MIKNINNNKILMISHIADIDGMGSVILAKKYFKDIDYILCELSDLKNIFKEDLNMYKTIYVCDLPMIKDAIDVLLNNSELAKKIVHFDHHESNKVEDSPYFINEVIELDGKKTCGTHLFYNYLLSKDQILNTKFYQTLVEGIRANDTWDMNGDFELGRKLSSLYSMIGPEAFINMILNLNDSENFILPEVFLDLIKADTDKMNKYIDNACKNLLITKYKDYTIGVTISEQYRSILGDEICKRYPEVDFAFIINFERNRVSLRCTNDIDLGKICAEFHKDGGGHKRSAGFILDSESIPKVQKYIDEYLQNIKK